MNIRNNVILTMSCGNRENAESLGRGIFTTFELNGECRNVRTVANKNGDVVVSLRSTNPLETVMDIAALLQRAGLKEFDLAFRHKLTEAWSIFHGKEGVSDRPKLRGVDDGFAIITKKSKRIKLLSRTTLSI